MFVPIVFTLLISTLNCNLPLDIEPEEFEKPVKYNPNDTGTNRAVVDTAGCNSAPCAKRRFRYSHSRSLGGGPLVG